MKNWFITVLSFLLFECQNNTKLDICSPHKSELDHTLETLEKLEKKINEVSFIDIVEGLDREFTKISSLQSTKKFGKLEIDQIEIPFLHPNGKSEEDRFLKEVFFKLLEILEALRYLIESYNKFIVNTNLTFLTHPAQVTHSDDIVKMINYRKIVRKEIFFVKNIIYQYNQKINMSFPNVSDNHKMAGYYSFDNTHFSCNQDVFSIEDIDNFSYSYHKKLVSKNVLKSKHAKLKLSAPELGTRRGTVFVNSGKPNILRGTFGNDFGSYNLGVAVGMTIEYAITGKIYYYKGAF